MSHKNRRFREVKVRKWRKKIHCRGSAYIQYSTVQYSTVLYARFLFVLCNSTVGICAALQQSMSSLCVPEERVRTGVILFLSGLSCLVSPPLSKNHTGQTTCRKKSFETNEKDKGRTVLARLLLLDCG